MKLEDLQPNASIRGLLPDAAVTVVSTQWHGADALTLIYRSPAGKVAEEILYRHDEPRLEVLEQGRPWSFDGDGALFRLVSEAHRIRLAHLFDPVLAVHTSLVEPLPHQITAVYEAMLPRQPLRFLLADDPGAGKTIMAGLLIKELIARGDLKRCLVVCPGSLVEQWQDELSRKFQLPFEILTNDKLEAARTGNWFAENDLAIARLDKLSRGANFQCLISGTPIAGDYIKAEGRAGRMGARLMAIVAEGDRGRVYLAPTPEHEAAAQQAQPDWKPETPLAPDPRALWTPPYGLTTYGDLFTPRQLVALTTFSDLVGEARERIKRDYLGARASRPQKEWHSRGYLPHWEAGERPQSLTFRLHDSLPQTLLDQWREELSRLPETAAQLERRKRIEAALDAGHGECLLRDPRIGKLVEEALLYFDQQRYRLHAWVIMPNHVHVLVTPLHGNSLSSLVHSWKSFTAKEANKLLGRTGAFWLEEYFDRAIRDETHFRCAVEYIEHNPVKAGLCAQPEDWALSSALGARSSRAHEERAGRPRSQDDIPLAEGGTGATAYAEAVGVYLAFAVDRVVDRHTSIATWDSSPSKLQLRNTFARQAIPMTWDFGEGNPLCMSSGAWSPSIEWVSKSITFAPATPECAAGQADASGHESSRDRIVSTDPPYYDNIGYADLSDFFYVWLRRSLRATFPDLFATLAVPKAEELVATPYRHGSKQKAEAFFLDGMTQAMRRLADQAHPAFPVTIYYAFKQSEHLGARASGPQMAGETPAVPGIVSTGWETFLDAVIRAGFGISGTWPMRTELGNRMIGSGTNALASSIILVCRKRATDAPTATRREFVAAMKAELPTALRLLQGLGTRASGPQAAGTAALPGIAPVDLAQAAIGPGMAVYTRYAKVLDAAGNPVTVREALALINDTLDQALAEQEGDFEADTRWALAWFEQHGFNEGEFGVAETLSKAKNTSVAGLVEAGILRSSRGKVRLLRTDELPADWDPATDPRLTAWETVHHLIRVLEKGGEGAAAGLIGKLGSKAETARELAYRLYTLCERKKRAAEALAYNGLVQSWPEITQLAQTDSQYRAELVQAELL